MLHLSYSREVVMRVEYQIFLNSPPPNLAGWIRPWVEASLTLSSFINRLISISKSATIVQCFV